MVLAQSGMDAVVICPRGSHPCRGDWRPECRFGSVSRLEHPKAATFRWQDHPAPRRTMARDESNLLTHASARWALYIGPPAARLAQLRASLWGVRHHAVEPFDRAGLRSRPALRP